MHNAALLAAAKGDWAASAEIYRRLTKELENAADGSGIVVRDLFS